MALNLNFEEGKARQGIDVSPGKPVQDPVTRWLNRLQAWWQRQRQR